MVTVLLVDAANVVGSRPDGWWRDRAGATARLLERLVVLPGRTLRIPDAPPLRCSSVLVVVEGRARDVPAPEAAGLRVLRAPGSGDDALAGAAAELAVAGTEILVVTADRGLRARLPEGTPVAGPRWLLAVLDGASGTADGGPITGDTGGSA